MTAWEKRRRELEEAFQQALKDLHLHTQSSTFHGIYGPLRVDVRPATEAELEDAKGPDPFGTAGGDRQGDAQSQ